MACEAKKDPNIINFNQSELTDLCFHFFFYCFWRKGKLFLLLFSHGRLIFGLDWCRKVMKKQLNLRRAVFYIKNITQRSCYSKIYWNNSLSFLAFLFCVVAFRQLKDFHCCCISYQKQPPFTLSHLFIHNVPSYCYSSSTSSSSSRNTTRFSIPNRIGIKSRIIFSFLSILSFF